jgi:hypothetical protein
MEMSRTTSKPTPAPAPAAADRFAALAVRRGLSLGALHSASARDFTLVLAAAAQAFPAGRNWSEREVNDRLRGFLATAGAMLATDHVELRRWLVDFRLLARDGFGRAYTAGSPAPEFAALTAELADVDLAGLATAARLRDAERREERKSRWERTQREAGG